MKATSIFVLCLILVGVIALVPSHQETKLTQFKKEALAQTKESDAAIWTQVEACSGFDQVADKKNGNLIVFMPTKGNDIAELADAFRQEVSPVNVRIVPLPDPNSPVSEKFLKVCMAYKWNAKNEIQQGVANGPAANKKRVDELWNAVDPAKRAKIDQELKENAKVFERVKSMGGHLRLNNVYLQSENMGGVANASRLIEKF